MPGTRVSFSRCGPKNGYLFAYVERGMVRIGGNHRPMTRVCRLAYFTRRLEQERRTKRH